MIKITSKEIITPKNDNWAEFLYLTGTLMESEILAIDTYRQINKSA